MDATKRDFRGVLEKSLQQQVTLGVEAVVTAVLSGSQPEDVSFRHVLNRAMAVAQVPVTFVVFKEDPEGHLQTHYKANKHPRQEHREAIERQCVVAKAKSTEMLIPLWGDTGYYLLVLKADPSKDENGRYEFSPLPRIVTEGDQSVFDLVKNIWDAAAYKLEQLFDEKNYTLYRSFFLDDLKLCLSRCADSADATKPYLPPENVPAVTNSFRADFAKKLLKNTTRYELQQKGVIDRVFQKLKKNFSKMTGNVGAELSLTNFMLFTRNYDHPAGPTPLRHGAYSYNLQMAICSSQRDEIEKHLEQIAGQRDRFEGIYNDQIADIEPRAKAIAKLVSERFWSELKTPSGRQRLLDLLADRFGQDARSMADPVFDGVSFYRAPFAKDGGIGRCFPDGYPEDFEPDDHPCVNDLLRVVMCHYFFESMATQTPDAEGTHLWVMLNPIELGGRVWGVVAYATRSKKPDDDFVTLEDVMRYHRFWLQNFHVYQDVNERMKKNLRIHMSAFYEAFVADRFSDWCQRVFSIPESQSPERGFFTKQTENLNNILQSLTRLFPYDAVKARLQKFEDSEIPTPTSMTVGLDGAQNAYEIPQPDGRQRAPLGGGWAIVIEAQAESCFPSIERWRRRFVDEGDMAVAMTDRIGMDAMNTANALGDKSAKGSIQ